MLNRIKKWFSRGVNSNPSVPESWLEIQSTSISYAEVWSRENQITVLKLNPTENKGLLKICDELTRLVSTSENFIMGDSILGEKFNENPKYLFGTSMEIVCLSWILVVENFTRRGIRIECENAFFYVIRNTLCVYDDMKLNQDFDSLESWFEDRQSRYSQIMLNIHSGKLLSIQSTDLVSLVFEYPTQYKSISIIGIPKKLSYFSFLMDEIKIFRDSIEKIHFTS